jgi:beta-glucosidase
MMGLFENPYADSRKAASFVNSEEHGKLAKSMADECMVLLKNDKDLLPVDRAGLKRVAVIGPKAISQSTGVYSSPNDSIVTIFDGLREKLGPSVAVEHQEGCKVGYFERVNGIKRGFEYPLEAELDGILKAVDLARKSDLAVVCVGSEIGWSVEATYAPGSTGDRSSLHLLGNQMELIRRVLATGTPTVVILMHGKPLAIRDLAAEAPAILDVFYLGQALGRSVADAILGDVNPSGRLCVSYPRSAGHLPVYYSQKATGFFKDYVDSESSALFPFGYGLSYSEFEYSKLSLKDTIVSIDEKLFFKLSVQNKGPMNGKETVQVYVHDLVASVTRPGLQLVAFQKIEVPAGASREVAFEVDPEELGFTGIGMDWTIEPGKFDLMIGRSSTDIALKTSFYLK